MQLQINGYSSIELPDRKNHARTQNHARAQTGKLLIVFHFAVQNLFLITMADITCNLCGKLAELSCQRCREMYCSTNCQVLDWREHKKFCTQMPILVPRDALRNRTPNNDNKNSKRPVALRNALRISHDDSSMPPMVDIKSQETITNFNTEPDFTLQPKLTTKPAPIEKEVKTKVSQVSSHSPAWKTSYPCPEGDFFDVIVQYAENNESGRVWVTECKYDGALRKLLSEINRNIDANTIRCSTEEIKIGALIAAPFENLYYRAEIIEIEEISKMVVVHLIDYGNVVDVAFKDLRSPIPIMRNLNAYAFCIRYTEPVILEAILCIRVVSFEPTGEAVVEVKIKNMPVELTAETFNNKPKAKLLKISKSGKYALLRLFNESVSNDLQEMDKLLCNDATPELKLQKPPEDGDYVVVHTLCGWSRALLMSNYHNNYLVYLIDEGRIALVEKVLGVPDKYKAIPMQVFATEMQKMLSPGKNFSDALVGENIFTFESRKVFAIEPQKMLLAGTNFSDDIVGRDERMPCYILKSDGTNVAEVVVFNYIGKGVNIDPKDWIEPLISGSIVHVTCVVSHSEIFIALVCTKMYPNIFTSASKDCEPLAPGNYAKGDLVLAMIDNEYFRAKVLDPTKGDALKVLNVDTGLTLTVSSRSILKPNLFILSCPYHTRKVNLTYLSKVESPYAENEAIAKLQQCQQNQVEFILKFPDSNPELGVELLLNIGDRPSLNKQLLPMVFEKRKNNEKNIREEIELPQKLSSAMSTPPPSPKLNTTTYTLKDLEVIPIPCGENVSIMILDSSTISKGYITGCGLANTDFLNKLESEYLPMVSKYCTGLSEQDEYTPNVEELCLAVYDVDNEWYRAMCVNKMKDDMFKVMFLDYGNFCHVHKSKIRKMTTELMFPANANMCIFDGIPEEVPKQSCEKFIMATQSDSIIVAKVTRMELDSYLLQLDNKDKYF